MEEELKRLISEEKVIPFIGAGVSKAVKFKDGTDAFVNWKELLEKFLDKIDNPKKKRIIETLLIEDEKYPIDYLEVAKEIEDVLSEREFNQGIKEVFSIDYNNIDESTYELAREIWNLNSKLLITTNYDKVLHLACEDKNIDYWDIESIHEQADYLRDGVENSTVWNLHGHISNVKNIILTPNKYNQLYTEDITKSEYKSSLQTLQNTIASKSLLFIGFSLDDEFIKKQIKNTIDIFGGNSCEHYILVKDGTKIDDLGGNIKTINYENHGQPLINKIKSLQLNIEKEEKTTQENKEETFKKSIIKNNKEKTSKVRLLTDIPPKNENFKGRIKDLETIAKKLKDGNISFIVNGIGGIGKSELAIKYFLDNKDSYNNVAFIELSNEKQSLEKALFNKLKKQLNLTEEDNLNDIIRKMQELEPRNLLLIDNLENKKDFQKIKALHNSFDLLITTRVTDLDSNYQLELKTMNKKDAKDFFLSIYNKDIDKDIDDILEYLDNHPLFIRLTAKSLNKEYINLNDLREEIDNNNIYKIDSENDKTFEDHINDRFKRQFEDESNNELKILLQVLSIFPSIELQITTLETCLKIDTLKIKLQKLVERGWISKKENSYKLHQIIKTFLLLNYKPKYKDTISIFKNISNHILVGNMLKVITIDYVLIIEEIIQQYKTHKNEEICDLHDSLAMSYFAQNNYNLALEEGILAYRIRKRLSKYNNLLMIKSYDIFSIILNGKRDFKKAIKYQEKALSILNKTFPSENNQNFADCFTKLGMIYDTMNDHPKSIEYRKKAIAIREKLAFPNDLMLAADLSDISLTYNSLGAYKTAFEYQKKSLDIKENTLNEEDAHLITSYHNISIIYYKLGQLNLALDYSKKAINFYEDEFIGGDTFLARSYNISSLIYDEMGNTNLAIEFQKKILLLKKEYIDEIDQIEYNLNLSMFYKKLKNCLEAKKHLEYAINIIQTYNLYKEILVYAKKVLKEININIKKEQKLNYKKRGKYCKEL